MTDATQLCVLLAEPIATINPALHGHFAEHLGELIYPGIWVGPDSVVPNVDGIRADVVKALVPLEIPVLRWPGGCFADDYNWRDGIGPRDQRPQRLNPFWGMATESGAFGTHEFMAFARALGATPYFAGSLGSGSPRELRDWIEYANHPSGSTLSDQRRANGAEDPFGIELWGIGNENWGCGGAMTPEAYAEEYARYRTFAFPFGGTKITGIACGPNGSDWAWTTRFFDQLETGTSGSGRRLSSVQGFAAHYYCQTAGTATEYTDSQWLELLTKASVVDGIIAGHRLVMDRYDPERKIGLILDEWGTWHPVEEGKPAGGLYQQNTIRDALVAAISLDTFHNHADKLVMANIAQLINVLQAVLLVDETRVVKTPTYHVFAMYAAHKGGQAVRLVNGSAVISNGEESEDACRTRYLDGRRAELRTVTGSASVTGDRLCVTLVNSDPRQPIPVDLGTWGGRVLAAGAVTLATDDIHDHNTFEAPETVTVGESYDVTVLDGHLRLDLPAASVTRIFATLG